jgi:hypothetical protein
MSHAPSHSPAERFSAAILRLVLTLDERPAGFVRWALMLLLGRELKRVRESLLQLGELLRDGLLLQPIQSTPAPTAETIPATPQATGQRPRAPERLPSQSPRTIRQPPKRAEERQASPPPAPPGTPLPAHHPAECAQSPPWLQVPRPAPAPKACGPPPKKRPDRSPSLGTPILLLFRYMKQIILLIPATYTSCPRRRASRPTRKPEQIAAFAAMPGETTSICPTIDTIARNDQSPALPPAGQCV